MASATEISYAAAAAMIDPVFNTLLEGGTNDAVIAIYTGTPPTDVETSPTGTLLGVCKMTATNPFNGAQDQIPNARIQAAAISDDVSADTTGIAGYFRASTSNDGVTPLTGVIQGSAGEAADSTDLTLDDKNIVVGGTISITGWDLTMPEYSGA
jgi:hypothetical protein